MISQSLHIVFAMHGLFGSRIEFGLFDGLFPTNVIYHPCKMYQDGPLAFITGTIDGIYEGAKRILNDMNSIINSNPLIQQISMIAGSLGGLYAREALGLFYEQHKENFESGRLQFHSFVTLASPHLGTEQLPIPLKILSYLTKSTREMTLLDEEPQKLLVLSEGIYFEALALFQQRILYAPLINDDIVSFESSGLAASFPKGFSDLIIKKERNWINYQTNKHIIKEYIVTKETLSEELKENKFYENYANADIIEKILINLRQLNWKRVLVLLDHEVLNHWHKPFWYHLLNKYNVDYRQDVMIDVIKKIDDFKLNN